MALYELSDGQVKNVLLMIENADIKGRDSMVIVNLVKVFQNPIAEKEEKESTEPTKKKES